MKVLILGAAKTGTTALFFKIKNSLEGSILELFEPDDFESFLSGSQNYDHTIAKLLIRPYGPEFRAVWSGFDKKIAIIRDPRDRLISGMLYNLFHLDIPNTNPEKIKRLVALLESKEKDPSSVSVVEIFEHLQEMMRKDISSQWTVQLLVDLFKQSPGFFNYKYEDLVAENFSDLEDYLDVKLPGQTQVDAQFQRVVRTKGAGDWKNWFLPSDVDFYKPFMQPFLEHFGYDNDWSLIENPHIKPSNCSLYVRNLIAERRATEAVSHQQFREILSMSQPLIRSLRTDIGPALINQNKLEDSYDQLLVILQTISMFLSSPHHLPQKLDLMERKMNLYKNKCGLLEAKLKTARAKLEGIRMERDKRKSQGLKRLLFWK